MITYKELQDLVSESEEWLIKEAADKGVKLENITDKLELTFGEGENANIIEIAYCTETTCFYIVHEWLEEDRICEFLDMDSTPLN